VTYVILTMADGCRRLPYGRECLDHACVLAARRARDEVSIRKAVEDGVIDP
jgi:hypothetical protein